MRRQRRAFTLIELLVVLGVLTILAALLLPTLARSKQSARVTVCTSHLRQIGLAYGLYLADWEEYPNVLAFANSRYAQDKRILFCPDDIRVKVLGAASSYRFDGETPPDFRPIEGKRELHPNAVLVSCEHHLGQREIVRANDQIERTPPTYPFHLVLRADGRVERIHLSRIKIVRVPKSVWFTKVYHGEPGYAEAKDERMQMIRPGELPELRGSIPAGHEKVGEPKAPVIRCMDEWTRFRQWWERRRTRFAAGMTFAELSRSSPVAGVRNSFRFCWHRGLPAAE